MNAPPELPPLPRNSGNIRVVVGLLLFALLDLVVQAYSVVAWLKAGGTISLTAPFSTLALGLAAWLVWRGNRVIWQILLYLAPIGFGLILGLVLASWLFLPTRFLRVLVLHGPESMTIHLGYMLLAGMLFGWLGWEAGRLRGASNPRRTWSRAPVLTVWGALPALLMVKLVLFLLQGSWTSEAIAHARGQLGAAYEYQVMSWHVQKQGGQTTGHAVVLAYNDHEMRQVQVRW
jgi:hypothetical protein